MTDLERYHHWNVTKERKFMERWQRDRERGAFWFILFWGSIAAMAMAMAMGFCLIGSVWLSTDFDFPLPREKAARSHGRSRGRQG